MARKSTKRSGTSKPKPPRYTTARCCMHSVYHRFMSKPDVKNFLIDSFTKSVDATRAAVTSSFPEYDFDLSMIHDSPLLTIKGFPYQMITENYTGKSILLSRDISDLLQSIEQTTYGLKKLDHPDPLRAACESKGLTLRAAVDLDVMYTICSRFYASIDLAFIITKPPIVPRSIAKIKLGTLVLSDENSEWCFKATLIGDYTPEQQALAAQELFRENAMFNKELGVFMFDHFPKSLVVVGENGI